MTGELSPIDKAKFVSAKRAAQFVEDGMRVGLGTGSTAAWLVRCLGDLVRADGLRIKNSAGTVIDTVIYEGTNSNGLRWAFRVNSAGSNGTVGGLRVEVAGDYIIGSDAINDGGWHHVAATFFDDGTPVVEDVQLYVDGVLQTTFTSGPGSPAINTSGSNQVTVGSSQLITGDDRSVRGLMDEVGIWSRVLSQQEIQTLASGTPIIPEPSTLAIFGFGSLGLIFRRRRVERISPDAKPPAWSRRRWATTRMPFPPRRRLDSWPRGRAGSTTWRAT